MQLVHVAKTLEPSYVKRKPELAGEDPDLGMRVQLVHGDEVIADSESAGGLAAACATFKVPHHLDVAILTLTTASADPPHDAI